MILSDIFVCATREKNSFENNIPAPMFRAIYHHANDGKQAIVTICGLGIYELYLNGERITKGYYAPYRSNPDHYLYYDKYDVTSLLKEGENVFGILLGNGFNHSLSKTWNFENNSWDSSPKFAFSLAVDEEEKMDATCFKWKDSEIRFDDFHFGEKIDANYVEEGWNRVGYNGSGWQAVLLADRNRGEKKLCEVEPILPINYRKPIRIIKNDTGYVFDFGVSTAGTYSLRIKGEKNKTIRVYFGDALQNGHIYGGRLACKENIREDHPQQTDFLTLSGKEDKFEPLLDYKGMRFAEITNLTEEELKTVDFTFIELSSSFDVSGEFYCDNHLINQLQDITCRADRSNFYYFPTDCPQREKNGWTGDAALSAEQLLLNYNCANSLKEWVKNICSAQRENGELPGIVPTGDWGYTGWNGTAWDNVLFELPYRIYVYTGDSELIEYCKPYMMKYLKYLDGLRNEKGLLSFGLGDWCYVNAKTPLVNTCSCMGKAICDLAVKCFEIIGFKGGKEYATKLSKELKEAIQKYLTYKNTTSLCDTQSDQALLLYYDISEDKEYAYKRLKDYIRNVGNHIDFGCVGNRAFWRVLGDNEDVEFAIKLMTKDEYPSFVSMLKTGATALYEKIIEEPSRIDGYPDRPENVHSLNHHFFGDISAFFYRYLAGIKIDAPNTVQLKPLFVDSISRLQASHIFPSGKFAINYQKIDVAIYANVEVPIGVKCNVVAPKGYHVINDPVLESGKINQIVFVKDLI